MNPPHRAPAPAERRARPAARAWVLRSVLLGVAAAGVVGLAALAAGRGVGKPPARAAEPPPINITLGRDGIDPAVMLLLPGPVHFRIRNASAAPRALRITGPGVRAETDRLDVGETGGLDVTFRTPGTYTASDDRGNAAEGTIRVRVP